MKFVMGIMRGFMRKAAIKWIKVRIMSVHFYVLLRNFLEDFKKDRMRKLLNLCMLIIFITSTMKSLNPLEQMSEQGSCL